MDRRLAAARLAATARDVTRSSEAKGLASFYHINSISEQQLRGESLMRNRMILACTTSALGLIAMPSVALAQNQAGPVTVESAPDDPTADDAIVVTAIHRSPQTSQAIKQDSDQIVDSILSNDNVTTPTDAHDRTMANHRTRH